MDEYPQSAEQRNEHYKTLLDSWCQVAEHILAAKGIDPQLLEQRFHEAKSAAAKWPESHRVAVRIAALTGHLTSEIFQPKWVESARRIGHGEIPDATRELLESLGEIQDGDPPAEG